MAQLAFRNDGGATSRNASRLARRNRPHLAESGPSSAEAGLKLFDFGRPRGKFGRFRAKADRFRASLGRCWPSSGQKRDKLGCACSSSNHVWAEFDRLWAQSDQSRQTSTRFRANFARSRPKFDNCSPESAKSGPGIDQIWPDVGRQHHARPTSAALPTEAVHNESTHTHTHLITRNRRHIGAASCHSAPLRRAATRLHRLVQGFPAHWRCERPLVSTCALRNLCYSRKMLPKILPGRAAQSATKYSKLMQTKNIRRVGPRTVAPKTLQAHSKNQSVEHFKTGRKFSKYCQNGPNLDRC